MKFIEDLESLVERLDAEIKDLTVKDLVYIEHLASEIKGMIIGKRMGKR